MKSLITLRPGCIHGAELRLQQLCFVLIKIPFYFSCCTCSGHRIQNSCQFRILSVIFISAMYHYSLRLGISEIVIST